MQKHIFKGKKLLFPLTLLFLISFSCRLPIPTPGETPQAATNTQTFPAATTQAIITNTPTATITATPAEAPPPTTAYLDDRSSPTGLMYSFFNALNRREYLRAYSYWRNAADSLGDFETYMAGYATTDLVTIRFGQIGGDAGAGQMYYNVPLVMEVLNSDATTSRFAACYILHLANPMAQGGPAFSPLAIDRGGAIAYPTGSDEESVLETICTDLGFPVGMPLSPNPVTNPADYSAANYLDDRSDVIQVARSMFNALNRHEFVRAYSYWKNPEIIFGTFEDFLTQYEETDQVEFVFGEPGSDPGAGQLYDYVSIAARFTHNNSTVETIQSCFVTHLSQPVVQASPPFKPRGIFQANFIPADNSVPLESLLAGISCGP